MSTFANRTFEHKHIFLDDHVFVDCTFRGCVLVYSGEALFNEIFRGKNDIVDSPFDFDGYAANTAHFMIEIGRFFPEIRDGWIHQIQDGAHVSPFPLAERHQDLEVLP